MNASTGASTGGAAAAGRSRRRPAWEYLVFAAVGLLILVGAVWAGGVGWQGARYGTIAPAPEAAGAGAGAELVEFVEAGERVSLVVPDRGASVGDSWSPAVEPAGALTLVDDGRVMDDLWDRVFGPAPGGGGGHHYFIFEAVRGGDATVTLTNCFQGRCGPEEPESRSVTWQIVVLD